MVLVLMDICFAFYGPAARTVMVEFEGLPWRDELAANTRYFSPPIFAHPAQGGRPHKRAALVCSFHFVANSCWPSPLTTGKRWEPYWRGIRWFLGKKWAEAPSHKPPTTSNIERAFDVLCSIFSAEIRVSMRERSGVEFAADAAPVPAEFMVAAGAGDVKEDASETGLSKLCLCGAI
jgi:hypothetical protein